MTRPRTQTTNSKTITVPADGDATPSSANAWHFLRNDSRLRDGELAVKGHTYTLPEGVTPVLCQIGYHASLRVRDALQYAPGTLLTRVRLSGLILYGDDKLVARQRTILRGPIDSTATLIAWACDCAERALDHVAASRPDHPLDPRSRAALVTLRQWINGEASHEDVACAVNPARAASASYTETVYAGEDGSYAASCAATAASYAATAASYAATAAAFTIDAAATATATSYAASAASYATDAIGYACATDAIGYACAAADAACEAYTAGNAESKWQTKRLETLCLALLDAREEEATT